MASSSEEASTQAHEAHEASDTARAPSFPPHQSRRVWFLSSGNSPIGITLTRWLLDHGDAVVCGMAPSELPDKDEWQRHSGTQDDSRDTTNGHAAPGNDKPDPRSARSDEFRNFLYDELAQREDWKGRYRFVLLDMRTMGQCQAAVAEAVQAFGRIDVLLCCTSESLVGTVEELGASSRATTLVRDQFETNFFGPVNIIKALLPSFRAQLSGHVIILGGITGQLGAPGLSMYCASGWALEGFCDSLAYEVAPFNIKVTIVQTNLEINVLTNRIRAVPPLPPYDPEFNPVPMSREFLGGMIERVEAMLGQENVGPAQLASSQGISSFYPRLPPAFQDALIAETVYALLAIGGHENPPARHIVGHDGVASIKERLKTVSEELEDFVEVSSAADIVENPETGSIARPDH
ncbi:NAD(P)-binding protein [Xylona heveae TC161]|uniref:NAD(P)-binding protein n=1 Tax=Xylona heveae (strain CBS 132557 / TC161) TaxID=1328760 RepID=A0A165FTX6_XYLHT|nr:NAD(P)-binding protein [Xylona heveae TC161]KZF21373.1 NAD(P)-binding protein [Xylona heveae TC161]